MGIHPTAIIEDGAKLGKNVEVGPYCVVGSHVILDDDVRLISHVSITGYTNIGARTVVYPFASLGHPPQDLKYRGEASKLTIGTDNTIREYVTMQPGTEGGTMETIVGNDGLFMGSVHIAHDCKVGNYVIMANHATLAGHVVVGDHVIIGGLVGVHQFARIGRHAILGGLSAVAGDVIPYGSVKGERAFLNGLNIIGLKRREMSREDIDSLRKAYGLLFTNVGTLSERMDETAANFSHHPIVSEVLSFLQADSKCGFCLPVGWGE